MVAHPAAACVTLTLAAYATAVAQPAMARDTGPRNPRGAAAHVGVPAGWLARYPCKPRLRPVVDAPRGAVTAAEACAAAVAVYDAWIAAARRSTPPFTPAALRDTGRVDGVLLLRGPGWSPLPGLEAVTVRDTTFSVELHFGPEIAPVVGVIDPRRGIRRVYPGEPFTSRAAYDRTLHPRRPRPAS